MGTSSLSVSFFGGGGGEGGGGEFQEQQATPREEKRRGGIHFPVTSLLTFSPRRSIKTNVLDKALRTPKGGGKGYLPTFILRVSTPRSNSLYCYIPSLTEKVPL